MDDNPSSNHLDLTKPSRGELSSHSVYNGDCELQRQHYFRRYANAIREKGRSHEIWPKWLNEEWDGEQERRE
jgi:hypothetical protein